MSLPSKFLVGAILIGAVCVSAVHAREKKIQRKDLPPAVEKTVAEQSKDATIKGFSTEVENGQTLYEVELSVNGRGKDISMDAQGSIVEIEEEVAMTALPPTVMDGLNKAAGKRTISKVEALTKNGKLVAYEAVVKRRIKDAEIQVGPDGKKLSHPE